MQESQPVIIALEPELEFQKKIIDLNKGCDRSGGQIDFSMHIPHITLWMGFLRINHIPSLRMGLEKVFYQSKVRLSVSDVSLFEGVAGNVVSIGIQKKRELELLQNRVHHFFEPFRERVLNYQGLDSASLSYVNDFAKKSLAAFDPHITVGFCDRIPGTLDGEFFTSDPLMFEMGNHCTCIRKIG